MAHYYDEMAVARIRYLIDALNARVAASVEEQQGGAVPASLTADSESLHEFHVESIELMDRMAIFAYSALSTIDATVHDLEQKNAALEARVATLEAERSP